MKPQFEILPAVYPNHMVIQFGAMIVTDTQEFDAVIEATYSAPDGAYDQELLFRQEIALVTLERECRLQYGDDTDGIITDLLNEAKEWTPTSIKVTPYYNERLEIRQLANEFSKTLLQWLGKDKMRAVVLENFRDSLKDPNYTTCASHGFCDSNMAMDEAFQRVMGREFVFFNEEQPETEQQNADDTDLINQAWLLAKRNHFKPIQ